MGQIDQILRRSSFIDTSGAEAPAAIQMVPRMAAGVYTQDFEDTAGDNLVGRLSLGILAAFIAGAVAFYVWTNGIQGGG